MTDSIHILLADDDLDDCMLFKEALEELQINATCTTVHDGEQLMQLLINNTDEVFQILFLDLNMPRKNGFACLTEIRSIEKLKSLPVIIFSTSYDENKADLLYKNGAQYYICKPSDFSQFKKIIHRAIALASTATIVQPQKDLFYLVS